MGTVYLLTHNDFESPAYSPNFALCLRAELAWSVYKRGILIFHNRNEMTINQKRRSNQATSRGHPMAPDSQ